MCGARLCRLAGSPPRPWGSVIHNPGCQALVLHRFAADRVAPVARAVTLVGMPVGAPLGRRRADAPPCGVVHTVTARRAECPSNGCSGSSTSAGSLARRPASTRRPRKWRISTVGEVRAPSTGVRHGARTARVPHRRLASSTCADAAWTSPATTGRTYSPAVRPWAGRPAGSASFSRAAAPRCGRDVPAARALSRRDGRQASRGTTCSRKTRVCAGRSELGQKTNESNPSRSR